MSWNANASVLTEPSFDDPDSFGHIYGNYVKVLTCLLSALVLWRSWRFSISPLLHPEQPKELPYWIPALGHGHAFFLDSNGLLARARRHFGSTKDPFALTAFGMTFYVVTQAKHSAEVYRNTETLSFEDFIQNLMRINGNDELAIKNIYSALPINKTGFPNPFGESLGVLAQRMHAHQLTPGSNLVSLQMQVKDWINAHAVLTDMAACTSCVQSTASTVEMPLYQWLSEYFIKLGQDVYFGEALSRVDPQLPSNFFVFDELIWKMLYQYPRFMSSDMTVPRSKVIAALKKYFEIPRSQRRDNAAWLINTMEDEMCALGVDNENLAVVMFHLYLAINTNTRKTAFWLLTFLLHNPSMLASFRDETAAAFDGHRLIDPLLIQDAARCPHVDAMWHETLRMSGWAASVRLITADTVIGGRLMRRGNRVMVPHRLLHFDEAIFGEAPEEFRPERWLDAAGRDLTKSPSWRPFGGGKTMCSGRFLARFSVTTFVATLLRRFDVEMVGKPAFPRADEGRPVLGTMSIREGDDFTIRLTPRVLE